MIVQNQTIKMIKTSLVYCVGIVLLSGCELFQLQIPAQSSTEVQAAAPRENSAPELAPNLAVNSSIVSAPVLSASRTTDSESVVTLLRYSRFISELNQKELEAEFEKIDAANKVERTERGMLKLAVLLSLPQSSFHNDERAEKLLSNFIADSKQNTAALREYAHMLLASVKQREDFRKEYNKLEERLKIERKEKQQLQNKLDALKSIEKSISKRQKDEGVTNP